MASQPPLCQYKCEVYRNDNPTKNQNPTEMIWSGRNSRGENQRGKWLEYVATIYDASPYYFFCGNFKPLTCLFPTGVSVGCIFFTVLNKLNNLCWLTITWILSHSTQIETTGSPNSALSLGQSLNNVMVILVYCYDFWDSV